MPPLERVTIAGCWPLSADGTGTAIRPSAGMSRTTAKRRHGMTVRPCSTRPTLGIRATSVNTRVCPAFRAGESLADCLERQLSSLFAADARRRVLAGERVLLGGHGYSQRALVSHLEHIGVPRLLIPTGEPLLYAFHGQWRRLPRRPIGCPGHMDRAVTLLQHLVPRPPIEGS